MKQKRLVSFILSAAMAVTMASPSITMAAATDGETAVSPQYGQEDLFLGYMKELVQKDGKAALYGEYGAGRLEGVHLSAYQALKARIGCIASGETAGTQITLPFSELGVSDKSWTAEELGVDAVVADGEITQDALDAWMEQNAPAIDAVLQYLLVDCPYTLYWFDKTMGVGTKNLTFGAEETENGQYVLIAPDEITYLFPVAEEFQDAGAQDPQYTVSQELIHAAEDAAGRAAGIVEQYADYSDYEKLYAYKETICGMVSYNHEAADTDTPYGNPWQLIWVFDGDDATNVVCEGYAKAFQYLCDLSEFESPYTASCLVDGTMSGAGSHMWNIVTMDDEKHYLADIANSDADAAGAGGELFLAGATGSVSNGYTVRISDQEFIYSYSAAMQGMYGEILALSETGYAKKDAEDTYIASGTYGETDIVWTLDKDGKLSFTGTGEMPELADGVPWSGYLAEIRQIVAGDGITLAASSVFGGCDMLKEVYFLGAYPEITGENLFDGLPVTVWTPYEYAESWKEWIEWASSEASGGNITAKQYCLSHSMQMTPEQPATCTKPGNIAYYACSVCGLLFSDADGKNEITIEETVLDPLPHAYGEWEILVPADCTNSGIRQASCSVCGYTQEEEIAAKGHVWDGQYTIDRWATCTQEGSRSISCKSCGEVKIEAIPAAGHSLVKTEALEAGCTKAGHIEYYTCFVCRKLFRDGFAEQEISEAETVIAAGSRHPYETRTVAATTNGDGYVYQKCKDCGNIADAKPIFRPAQVNLSQTAYTYNGGAKKPAVTVYDSKGAVISPEYYTVTYSKNKNVGTAVAQVKFQGIYSGTVTRTFTIRPKSTSVSKLSGISGGFTVKWKKVKKQVTGYQIQYAKTRSFKGAKTKTYEKTVKASVTKLAAGKKYYVRVRSYQTVDGVMVYSGWSKAKTVKTKR